MNFLTSFPANRPRVRQAMLAADRAFDGLLPPHTREEAAQAVVRFDEMWYRTFDPAALYGDPEYWMVLSNCWRRAGNVGTRNTTYCASNWLLSSGHQFNSICDLHGGMGHAAVMMAHATGVKVFAHITQPSMQDICREAAARASVDVEVVADPAEAGVITAFEVLEHIDRPFDLLDQCIPTATAYLDASSWTTYASGHWASFYVQDRTVPAARMPKELTSYMATAGMAAYDKITGYRFRDNRPRAYVRGAKT